LIVAHFVRFLLRFLNVIVVVSIQFVAVCVSLSTLHSPVYTLDSSLFVLRCFNFISLAFSALTFRQQQHKTKTKTKNITTTAATITTITTRFQLFVPCVCL